MFDLRLPVKALDKDYANLNLKPLLFFTLPFIIYALTCAPTVYRLDSAELTTAAVSGGFVHPTGYPLYLILGWWWSRLPLGDMGFRMNLFSALNGALTILLAERILHHLKVNDWAKVGALGLLATGFYFWALSIVAEVYTLQTVLTAAIILITLKWDEDPRPSYLFRLALVIGLSFGNHASTVLLMPALGLFMVTKHPTILNVRLIISAALFFMLGLSVYLYLPIRYGADPAFNYLVTYDAEGIAHPINLRSFQGLWWVMSGRAFKLLVMSETNILQSITDLATQLLRDFWFVSLGPAWLGLISLFRRNRRVGLMLLLMSVFHTGFYLNYGALDRSTMYLPVYLIFALWLGIGLDGFSRWLHHDPSLFNELVLRFIQVSFVALVALAVIWNWLRVDLSENYSVRDDALSLLTRLEPNALILGDWTIIPPIEYLQIVEKQRPDVQAINVFMVSNDLIFTLIRNKLNHQPVYVQNISRSILEIARLEYLGDVYRLYPKEEVLMR